MVFCYNRYDHIVSTLEALKNNTVQTETVYIFQDGPKTINDKEGCDKVREYIIDIELSNKKVISFSENKGCSQSIIDGIDYVLRRHDAVIVIEDDCVSHKEFIKYMIEALEFYVDNKRVFSIGGHSVDVDYVPKEDFYFCGRTESWGWGTWKNRWELFSKDYEVLSRINESSEAAERLSIWGPDLPNMLVNNLLGKIDAWDVFWALIVIEHNGICLVPKKSLIKNIGLDGSGTHCGNAYLNIRQLGVEESVGDFYPTDMSISSQCMVAYRDYYNYVPDTSKRKYYNNILFKVISGINFDTEIVFSLKQSKAVAIWGIGEIASIIMGVLDNTIKVKCFVQSRKNKVEFLGMPVYGAYELPKDVDTILVVPGYDIDIIKRKMKFYNRTVNFITIDELLQV